MNVITVYATYTNGEVAALTWALLAYIYC